MTSVTAQQPRWMPARLAVLAMFFINGALISNWIARIPTVQENLGLSEGGLGVALLGLAVGVLTALSLVGGAIGRYSSRMVLLVTVVLHGLVMVLAGLAFDGITLFAALFVVGFFTSSMDIAMNAQAVEIEKRVDQTIMNSFHAMWSIGGVTGATMGAFFAEQGVEVWLHLLIIGVGFALLALPISRALVVIPGETDASDNQPVFRLPERTLWPLGIVAFSCALGEGSMADWAAVYLRNVIETDVSTAAFGYAAFQVMMTVGRLSGDAVSRRIAPEWLVRGGGLLAATGLLLAIFVPTVTTSLIGFGMVGLGLSVTVPLAFSAAGKMPGLGSGVGIAGVATIGYAGFLAGPPVIGLLAEVTSLPAALGLIALIIGSLFVTGRAMRLPQTASA